MKIMLGSSNSIQTIKTENMCYNKCDIRGTTSQISSHLFDLKDIQFVVYGKTLRSCLFLSLVRSNNHAADPSRPSAAAYAQIAWRRMQPNQPPTENVNLANVSRTAAVQFGGSCESCASLVAIANGMIFFFGMLRIGNKKTSDERFSLSCLWW